MGVHGNYIYQIESGDKEIKPDSSIAKLFDLLEQRESETARTTDEPRFPYGMNAREKLKTAREAAGFSQKELAKKIGYALGVLQAIEDGGARISEKMVDAIVKVVPGLTKEDLMGGSDYAPTLSELGTVGTFGAKPNIMVPPGDTVRYVPLISWAQAGALGAGHLDEGYEYEGVAAFNVKCKDAFAVEIRGDSMSPQINEGDRVVVCPSWTPQAGDTVIARTVDGDVYCKLLQRTGGDRLVLVSANSAHANIEISREEVAWIYPVSQVTKNLRRA